MDVKAVSDASGKNRTTLEKRSEREVVLTRTIDGPARIVFDAWTKPELIKRWWTPKSINMSFLACEMDVRVGGRYRFVFSVDGGPPMEFVGKYLEVVAPSRLVWTNEEGGEADPPITTLTLEERGGKTVVVMSELHPSKESLEAALSSGAYEGMRETIAQLDELVVSLAANAA